MALPRSIQEQQDRANAMLAAVNGPPQPVEVPTPTPAPTAPPAPPAEPPTPPAAAAPSAPVPVPTPAPVAPETAEQRWRSLQGINQSLRQQNQQLQDRLAALEARLTVPPAPPPTEPPKPPADPKDVEAFGLDMVSMVQRVCDQFLAHAAQQIDMRFAAVTQAIEQLQQQVQGTHQSVALTAEQVFFSELTKLVPNWQEINGHDAFLAYLEQIDPIYGRPRQLALDEAQRTANAQRAAAIFKAFIATLPPPPAAPPAESPTPRGAGAPPPPTPQGKPVYTQATLAKFYDDLRRGVYRSRPQDAERLNAEFNTAIAEGRVV